MTSHTKLTSELISSATMDSDEESGDDYDVDGIYDATDSEIDNESVASDESDELTLDENSDSEINLNSNVEYKGKDGTTWDSTQKRQGRTAAQNTLRGPIDKVILPTGKRVDEPIDSFQLYVDKHVIETLTVCTNKEALRYCAANKWKAVDNIEINAFIALLILAGVDKDATKNYKEFWHPLFGSPIFRATMGKNRFAQILRFLRFDDKETRSNRRRMDKLAPIRDIWDIVNNNLKKHYIPTENLTIDEQLVPFRGRVSFRQYIPSKPDKYGLKIWWICDSTTGYPLNGIPYLGKENGKRGENLGYNVVVKLAEPYERSNRNITCDNYFTSYELAMDLLSNDFSWHTAEK